MLSEDKVNQIREEIGQSSISIQELKDDLLDHFCCFIEEEIKKGKSFEAAHARAMEEICPNGFDEIQKETVFLLNANKIILMKKLMYSIGLLSSITISVGWIFKIMHWPGGNELFIYGSLAFMLLFVPMLAIERYKMSLVKTLSEKLRTILGIFSALLIGISVALKILGVTGADITLLAGGLMFTFGFLPFMFFRMYQKSIE